MKNTRIFGILIRFLTQKDSLPKKIFQFAGLGLAILAFVALLARGKMFMGLQKSIQNKFYDFASASEDIVIVAIDEKSLSADELGPLQQWPRETYARAIENLARAGASVIGVDITFPDASIHGPEDDAKLRDALRRHPDIILAGRYYFEEGKRFAQWPNDTLMEAKPRIGWINVNLDPDGFIRQIPVFAAVREKVAEAFSLEVAQAYLKAGPADYRVRDGIFMLSDAIRIPVMSVKDAKTNQENHLMYVNYFAEPMGYRRISMSDTAKGDFTDLKGKAVDLKNKIVLIGPTAIDLQDYYLSPVSSGVKMPGVEIHANNVQTVIAGKFLRDQSPLSLWLTLAALIFLNLVLFSVLRVRFAVPILFLEMFSVLVAGIAAYEYRVFLNVLYPLFSLGFTFVSAFLLRFILEQKEKKFVTGAFSHYVNPQIVDQIVKNPDMLQLGGAKREVTVFFSDIEGFTSFSEKMEPASLVEFLNGYLGEMTKIILGETGTLDKYEGDAIMAFWGAPIPQDAHARNACRAALENQKKLLELHTEWQKQGLPPFRVRIGINSGEVIAGNMGSENRFSYTVMGDAVNLASRLEGVNKQYGTHILISEATQDQTKDDFIFRELDLIRVKGKEKPVRIFELLCAKGEESPEALNRNEAFAKALVAYRSKNFTAAAPFFKALADDPASLIFARRCDEFLKNPPPADWDGVWTFTEK